MILPGATLGVLGGGQLGRMFTSEAQRMGYRVVVLDPDPLAPAGQIADFHLARSWTDPEALGELSERCTAITTEFENVPADILRALAAHRPVRPGADAVSTTQDRVREKAFLNSLGIATATWAAIECVDDVAAAWSRLGERSAILKTSRLGYDGKGQHIVESREDTLRAWQACGEVPCILERKVALEREVSVMVARAADGECVTWPVAENVHRRGVLHSSVVPAAVPDALAAEARDLAIRVANALEYVGVMGVECFIADGGRVLVNELAPRPHNSGHWTLDASTTSQFEQQVRCLTAMPLGETTQLTPIAMLNVMGDLWKRGEPRWDKALAVPGVKLHLYGKREARPGRKMGHLTAVGATVDEALYRATSAWESLSN